MNRYTSLTSSSLALLLLLHASAEADEKPVPGKQVQQVLGVDPGEDLRREYWLYLPKEYDSDRDRRWPLLLFLHGAGERGKISELVKKHGPPKLCEKMQYPFIVLSPQCPSGKRWQPKPVRELLDEVCAKHHVDKDRLYATGLSMGGAGTWYLASAYPGRFAAIMPICGGADKKIAPRLKQTAVWAFVGARDRARIVSSMETMVAAINKGGGEAKLTVFPKTGHNAWTPTYTDKKVYDWMLKQRRGGK